MFKKFSLSDSDESKQLKATIFLNIGLAHQKGNAHFDAKTAVRNCFLSGLRP